MNDIVKKDTATPTTVRGRASCAEGGFRTDKAQVLGEFRETNYATSVNRKLRTKGFVHALRADPDFAQQILNIIQEKINALDPHPPAPAIAEPSIEDVERRRMCWGWENLKTAVEKTLSQTPNTAKGGLS